MQRKPCVAAKVVHACIGASFLRRRKRWHMAEVSGSSYRRAAPSKTHLQCEVSAATTSMLRSSSLINPRLELLQLLVRHYQLKTRCRRLACSSQQCVEPKEIEHPGFGLELALCSKCFTHRSTQNRRSFGTRNS